MSKDNIYQEKLAIEYMDYKYCSECKFYRYNKDNQICLFHSEHISSCKLVHLNIIGKLNNGKSIIL